jgi:hydrogenase nickel incorporation protein HypA/HybF
MHELAIAESIARSTLRHAGERSVLRIDVRVGALRQVIPGSLAFAFAAVAKGTPLERAELALAHVPVRGRCEACGVEGGMRELPLRCERCGSLQVEVLAGEELCLESIEVEDALVAE